MDFAFFNKPGSLGEEVVLPGVKERVARRLGGRGMVGDRAGKGF